jgi:adenylate cyclase
VSGLVAFADRRYDEAIRELSAVRDSVPRSELVLEYLAAAYAYLGEPTKAQATVAELRQVLPITNLAFYEVMRADVGTPEQTARFVEGLRLAGVPPWPFDDRRRLEDRVGPEELGRLATTTVWTGRLQNGAAFVQYFDQSGGFAYRSTNSLLSGRSRVRDGQLCQQVAGYLMDRETCGYVYRDVSAKPATGESYVYVSSDAVKYFSVSR